MMRMKMMMRVMRMMTLMIRYDQVLRYWLISGVSNKSID